MFPNTAVQKEQMIKLYQNIDDFLYGMNRNIIDIEKAYKMVRDAPDSESDPIINVLRAYFVDKHSELSCYKSIKVQKNQRKVNKLYRKAVNLNIIK